MFQKKKFVVCALILVLFFFSGCKKEDSANTLTVYCYDSFASEWGMSAAISDDFKNKTGITLNWVSAGDAGQLLSKLIAEDGANADVVFGIDNSFLGKAVESNLFESYEPAALKNINPLYIADPLSRLIPYDYGYLAINYDTQKLKTVPKSLKELGAPQYKGKLALINPATSSTGLAFLHWLIADSGANWKSVWKEIKPSVLTIPDSWDAAYGLFTAGEVPMVLSYTTSPAYHIEFEKNTRYQALLFQEGNYLQVEFAGLLKKSKKKENAKKLLDYIYTPSFQEKVALTNFMYPVVETTVLPESFPNPKEITPIMLSTQYIKDHNSVWINEWQEIR